GNNGSAPASGFANAAQGSAATVSETAHSGTTLSNYSKSISCTNQGGTTGGYGSNTGLASLTTSSLQYGDKVTCTITNSRAPQVRLVKSLVPSNDLGTFDLNIQQGAGSLASASGVGNNGSAPASGFVNATAGSGVTVSETAHSGTSLADYDE